MTPRCTTFVRFVNEVFGEEQFHSDTLSWESNKRGHTYEQIATTHEFLVLYSISHDCGF